MIKSGGKLRIKSSSNMSLTVFLVLVLVVFITLFSERHYFRWDLTSTDEHSLNEKTIQVLKNVQEQIVIKAFVREGFQEAEDAKRLLSAYRYLSQNISYELIDPERNPAMAGKYGIKNINTYVLEGYGQSQTVKISDEEHITNAIIKLISRESKKVYWITGHGERLYSGNKPDFFIRLHERLNKENFDFFQINLMTEDIPEDASLVVLAAPQKELFLEERKSIDRYLKKGGSVLLFLEPFKDGGLKGLLESYGINITDDIVVDKMSRVMGGDYLLPMVANYGDHAITEDFQLTSLFSVARSVEMAEKKLEGVKLTALAFTSPQSWSEVDRKSIEAGQVQLDETDRKGPISLAVIAELEPPVKVPDENEKSKDKNDSEFAGRGKLVVFGDADFASDRLIEMAGNGDFISNTVNYLTGRGELITIRKKHRPIEPLSLTRKQGLVIFWIPVVVIPLIVLLVGVLVWYRRRSR